MWISAPAAPAQDPCVEFQRRVDATYNFKPSKLSKVEQQAKAKAMDQVWSVVKTNTATFLPCLTRALEATNADSWFCFDGSALLVEVSPTSAAKTIQVRHWLQTDLNDVDLRIWVQTLALRATEGFDITRGAVRWLDYTNAKYYLPQHGAFEVNKIVGATFLLGCMDEALAVPGLTNIIADSRHPHREFAAAILFGLATTESLSALKQIDLSTFPERTRRTISNYLARPPLVTPREGKPKVSREEFLNAFEAAAQGKWDRFEKLVQKVPDGEKDAVVVLKQEDLTLLRKVRRLRLASCSPHALSYYRDFTSIILTLLWNSSPGLK